MTQPTPPTPELAAQLRRLLAQATPADGPRGRADLVGHERLAQRDGHAGSAEPACMGGDLPPASEQCHRHRHRAAPGDGARGDHALSPGWSAPDRDRQLHLCRPAARPRRPCPACRRGGPSARGPSAESPRPAAAAQGVLCERPAPRSVGSDAPGLPRPQRRARRQRGLPSDESRCAAARCGCARPRRRPRLCAGRGRHTARRHVFRRGRAAHDPLHVRVRGRDSRVHRRAQ